MHRCMALHKPAWRQCARCTCATPALGHACAAHAPCCLACHGNVAARCCCSTRGPWGQALRVALSHAAVPQLAAAIRRCAGLPRAGNRCHACTSTLMYSSLAVRGAVGHSQPGSAQPLQPGCALCCRQCFVGAATRAMQCSTCCSWAALLLLFYFCSRFCFSAFHAALQFAATYM